MGVSGRPRIEIFSTFKYCEKCRSRTGRLEQKNGFKNGIQQWRLTCVECDRKRVWIKNAKSRANK